MAEKLDACVGINRPSPYIKRTNGVTMRVSKNFAKTSARSTVETMKSRAREGLPPGNAHLIETIETLSAEVDSLQRQIESHVRSAPPPLSHVAEEKLRALPPGEAPAAPSLNSLRIGRIGNTIFIALPRALWRSTGIPCNCVVCKGAESHWDTLAVSIAPDGKSDDVTWTVHYPELQKP